MTGSKESASNLPAKKGQRRDATERGLKPGVRKRSYSIRQCRKASKRAAITFESQTKERVS
jgi:hypothetical protein